MIKLLLHFDLCELKPADNLTNKSPQNMLFIISLFEVL